MKTITLESWIKNPFETLQKIALPNGITIYAVVGPFSQYARSNFIFPTGSYLDENYKRGLSHFVEHTIFDEGDAVLWNFGQKHSISINGFTNISHNYYRVNGYEHFPTFLEGGKKYSGFMDIFRKTQQILFQESSINEGVVQKQRQIISQEFYRKFPHGDKEFFKMVETFPHGILNPLGYPESVQSITLADIVSFKKKYYRPENCTVILVCSESILSEVIQSLESIPISQESHVAEIPQLERFFSRSGNWSISKWDIEQSQKVLISNHIIHDCRRQEIMIPIFISWARETLLNELREKRKLIYSVEVQNSFSQVYTLLDFEVAVEPQQVESVQEYFDNFFENLRMDETSFERIRNLRLAGLRYPDIYTEDTIITRMRNDIFYFGAPLLPQNIISLFEKLKLEHVNDFLDFFAQNREKHVVYP